LQCLITINNLIEMKKVFGILFVAGMVAFASCTSATEATEEAAAVVDSAAATVDSAAATVDSAATAVVDSVAK